MSHPTGVLPLGMMLMQGGSLRPRNEGLGAMSVLNDALVLELLSHLGPRELANFAQASKAGYAFANSDSLWAAHVLEVMAAACSS